MSRVLPGVALVLASPLWLHSMFMRLDLPTLERPINANSALLSFGHILSRGALRVNCDDFIIMVIAYFVSKGTKKRLISVQ